MLVIAIDGREAITELVRYMVKHHPQVHVIARAVDRHHVYELYSAGCRDIIRESFDGAVRIGRSAYEALGMRAFEAERLARDFANDDKQTIADLAALYDPSIPAHKNAAYVAKARQINDEREAQLAGGSTAFDARSDRAWTPPTLDDVDTEQQSGR